MRTSWFLPAAVLALATPATAQLVVDDLNSGLTPTDLANALTGGGLTISNVQYFGRPECAGLYSGGDTLVGLGSGVILASGRVVDAVGPNNSDGTSGNCGGQGDPDLDVLAFPWPTRDRAVLEFDFVCEDIDFITFRYVFASEEYNEYVNTFYNDVFGFFLNGTNVAYLPDGVTPVSIDNVNGGGPIYGDNASNPAFFINNDLQDGGGSINIEYDGLTVVLEVNAPVIPGDVNHIKLAIADASDSILDSAVFLEANSFTCGSSNEDPTCVADLADTELVFYQPTPGQFVVTEDTTFFFEVTGMDPEGEALTVDLSGIPTPPASLTTSVSGSNTVAWVTWTPTAADKGGAPYTAAVTFTDPQGATSVCEVVVADINLRPDCSATEGAGGTLTYECSSPDGAEVTLVGVATDGDDAVLGYHWDVPNVTLDDENSATATGVFPLGTTIATLTVTDGRGGIEMCEINITVQDTTPPVLSCTTDTAMLWPPNHKMHDVAIVMVADDPCMTPGSVSVSALISSDEPDNENGLGDGNTDGDVNGYDGYVDGGGFGTPVDVGTALTFDSSIGANGAWVGTIQLRAERDGTQDGRKYTLHLDATDGSGNVATTSCCVIVPHDKRKK